MRRAWDKRHPGVVPLAATATIVGAFGLLLPWLIAPVTSDSRYHYLLAVERFPTPWSLATWTIADMDWRLRQGRITPFGVLYQHVFYDAGMRLSLATGIETWQAEAVVKVVVLSGAIGSFWWLAGSLRGRDAVRLSRRSRLTGTAVFSVVLVSGITTHSPTRNGWTTFVLLCVGGIAILFTVLAATASLANRWPTSSNRRRALGSAVVAVVGALLVVSYELHWAAYPAAVVLVVLNGRSSWRPRALLVTQSGRWWAIAALSAGFIPTWIATRVAIHRYGTGDYPGLTFDLGGPVAKTTVLQLINAAPGTGLGLVSAQGGASSPPIRLELLAGGGWIAGLLLGLGSLLLVRHWSGGQGSGSANASTAWTALVPALAVAAVVGALIVSVSPQSHEIVDTVGKTYRATPWIWASFAGIAAGLAMRLGGVGHRLVSGAILLLPLAVGALVWPANVEAVHLLRQDTNYAQMESLAKLTVLGSDDEWAVSQRCAIDESMSAAATTSYRKGFNHNLRLAYRAIWGRPLCPERAAIDAQIDGEG